MASKREKLSSEDLTIVLSHYDLGIVQEVQDFPRGSHSAAKVVVRTDRGKFLLKRRPVGRDGPYRVAFSHALQRYLASKNFPLPLLIGTREDNNSMLKIDEAIYEVFEFIDAGPYEGGLVATYEAGKTLALYHTLVKDYHPQWNPPRGHYHDSRMVYGAFKPMAEILLEQPEIKRRRDDLIDLLKQLKECYSHAAEKVNDLGMPTWEVQIVHSDWHPGNMLFDHEHVVAVIDYDSARIRPRVMDVANGCLQFAMVTGGADLATWEFTTDTHRSKRFLRGYDELSMLTKAEIEAVPYLMQEVLIAQTVRPILKTGKFARWDGFEFLKVMLGKAQWLNEHQGWTKLDAKER